MQNTKDNPGEHQVEDNSDNVIKNVKYIKMLELQRSVLNKLIDTTTFQSSSQNCLDQDSVDN